MHDTHVHMPLCVCYLHVCMSMCYLTTSMCLTMSDRCIYEYFIYASKYVCYMFMHVFMYALMRVNLYTGYMNTCVKAVV